MSKKESTIEILAMHFGVEYKNGKFNCDEEIKDVILAIGKDKYLKEFHISYAEVAELQKRIKIEAPDLIYDYGMASFDYSVKVKQNNSHEFPERNEALKKVNQVLKDIGIRDKMDIMVTGGCLFNGEEYEGLVFVPKIYKYIENYYYPLNLGYQREAKKLGLVEDKAVTKKSL